GPTAAAPLLGQRGGVPPDPVGAHAGGVVGVAALSGSAARPKGQPVGRPGAAPFARRSLQGPEARGVARGNSGRWPPAAADAENPHALPGPAQTDCLNLDS